MKALCQCGCGLPAPIAKHNNRWKGWVAGKPLDYRQYHHPKTRNLHEYREEDRGYETLCWIWQRATNGTYGCTGKDRDSSGSRVAHRVVYERHKAAIPPGLDLDHLCRVPLCVNPDHLEPVTRGENLRRGYAARRLEATGAALR